MSSPVKQVRSKESAGLLMDIIRNLSSSADAKQREDARSQLERDFEVRDKALDKLLKEHLRDTTDILQAFSKISGRLENSQEKIHAIKDNLISCKNLLHCKRDELRKLWIEGIEHKTMSEMLDQIEEVKAIADRLQVFIDKKHYLHATDLLVKCISLLEQELSQVEGLRDIKAELITKKKELYDLLIDELNRQIYSKSVSHVVKGFQRQGSLRQSNNKRDKTSLVKAVLLHSTVNDDISSSESKYKSLSSYDVTNVLKPQTIVEDLNVEAEDNPVHFIAIIIECLTKLNRCSKGIDSIRSQISPGLLAIVQRSSQQVADYAYFEADENPSLTNQPQYLLELLDLILQQFRIVAHVHQIVLANFIRLKASNSELTDVCLYDAVEVWTKIQNVLQLFMSEYLDVRNTAGNQPDAPDFDQPAENIGAYFSKKKINRMKKNSLFHFENSSHAISMNSYLREQRQEFYGSEDIMRGEDGANKTHFVCKPCASNVTVIYNPIQKFISEIEQHSKLPIGSSTLQAFVTDFIKTIFLGQVSYDMQNSIDSATKGFDAQKTLIDVRMQKELNVTKPLLLSTVTVSKKLRELRGLMAELPDYADQFLSMICKLLQDYKETCNNTYAGIVLLDSEEKRIISATWAKDEDINRFVRTLPSWQNVKDEESTKVLPEISEEDMRAMNSKESSILTSNLSSTECVIPQNEILTDVKHLRTLGNMCESLSWFSEGIRVLAKTFINSNSMYYKTSPQKKFKDLDDMPPLTVSDNTLQKLLSLADEFLEMSELCIIVLHLEVRVHCFYYLLPIATQSNYCGAIDDMDPDFNVLKLNKDLQSIEEVMSHSLQPRKFRYIYEGLGHLVSTILINSMQYFRRINENGIKKMCRNIFAIQQCLTNITANRESDLDHARQYYELLYLSPDDLLNKIRSNSNQFPEQQLINLVSLSHRSERGAKEEEYEKRITKLHEILAKQENYESSA